MTSTEKVIDEDDKERFGECSADSSKRKLLMKGFFSKNEKELQKAVERNKEDMQ